MKDRNKIIKQLLIVSEEYDLDIINRKKEMLIHNKEHNNFIIKYSYEKDNMYDVNSFSCYIKIKIGEY